MRRVTSTRPCTLPLPSLRERKKVLPHPFTCSSSSLSFPLFLAFLLSRMDTETVDDDLMEDAEDVFEGHASEPRSHGDNRNSISEESEEDQPANSKRKSLNRKREKEEEDVEEEDVVIGKIAQAQPRLPLVKEGDLLFRESNFFKSWNKVFFSFTSHLCSYCFL